MKQLENQKVENSMHERVQAVIACTKSLEKGKGDLPNNKQKIVWYTKNKHLIRSSQNLWSFSTRRTLQQNACMWALLADISRQLNWQGMHLSKSEWKDRFIDYMEQLYHVPLPKGRSTSQMSIEQMRQFIGLIVHFGLMHGVEFNFSAAEKQLCHRRLKTSI